MAQVEGDLLASSFGSDNNPILASSFNLEPDNSANGASLRSQASRTSCVFVGASGSYASQPAPLSSSHVASPSARGSFASISEGGAQPDAWGCMGSMGDVSPRSMSEYSPRDATAADSSRLLSDWWVYLANHHVLLAAIGFAPPAHPSPPHRRRLVFATSLAFAFFLASCLFLAKYNTLPTVPRDYSMATRLLMLLRDWPTTLSVALQLLWDVPGASLGSCPCVSVGPPALRKPCGLAMLCCIGCQQLLLGVFYLVAGVLMLLLLGPRPSWHGAWRLGGLFVETKLLAYILAFPISSLVFFALRLEERQAQKVQTPTGTCAPGFVSPGPASPRMASSVHVQAELL